MWRQRGLSVCPVAYAVDAGITIADYDHSKTVRVAGDGLGRAWGAGCRDDDRAVIADFLERTADAGRDAANELVRG